MPFWLWLHDVATFPAWEDVNHDLAASALFFLSVENMRRKFLIRLVRWRAFDWTMLMVILANCVTLAMDSNAPGFSGSAMGMALATSNVVFIAIFIFEATCKIIALGFVFAEHTYLRNGG